MSGVLYGVGLGPGDPELMTLKAHGLIIGASVIAYPAPEGGESFARAIAAESMPCTPTPCGRPAAARSAAKVSGNSIAR